MIKRRHNVNQLMVTVNDNMRNEIEEVSAMRKQSHRYRSEADTVRLLLRMGLNEYMSDDRYNTINRIAEKKRLMDDMGITEDEQKNNNVSSKAISDKLIEDYLSNDPIDSINSKDDPANGQQENDNNEPATTNKKANYKDLAIDTFLDTL